MKGRWTYRISAAGVLVLAAAAFTLSYDALHQLALDCRVRPGLAWMWPVVIDGTIVVALLTVLAAKGANAPTGYPWALAGLFSLASVAFNVAHAPDRPVAQLVFAMAPVALVLTTHLLMQQAGWRQPTRGQDEPLAAQQAGPEPAHPHRSGNDRISRPALPDQPAPAGARARVRAAYEAQVQAGQTPTGAGLARAAGVSEGTANGCWQSSSPTRRAVATRTATTSRLAAGPITTDQTTQKGGDHDRAVTVKEAADRLGTAERFIRRLIFERRIPYSKLGRHVRIAARDLDAFVRAGRVEAGEGPLPTRRGA